MRVLIQRVSQASVSIDGKTHASIGPGLLLFVGIGQDDKSSMISKLSSKIVQIRIFADEQGKMNRSVLDINGEILAISQFTLHADTKKGNRPSFIQAARPETAVPIYEQLIQELQKQLPKRIQTGIFGADMQVSLINDGPVTIFIDTDQWHES